MSSADVDVLTAIQRQWDTGIYRDLLAGGLYTDDLPARVAVPYGEAETDQGADPQYQAPVGPGDPYLDTRRVLVKVVHVGKEACAVALAKLMTEFFYDDFTLVMPEGVAFRGCKFAGEHLDDQAGTRRGERVWLGWVEVEFQTVRFIP